jgi:hypothetical protein
MVLLPPEVGPRTFPKEIVSRFRIFAPQLAGVSGPDLAKQNFLANNGDLAIYDSRITAVH